MLWVETARGISGNCCGTKQIDSNFLLLLSIIIIANIFLKIKFTKLFAHSMRAVHFYSKICYDFTSFYSKVVTIFTTKVVCTQSQS